MLQTNKMKIDPILNNFKRYFSLVYADNDQLRKQVYKIRYDVFCDELNLEKNCPKDIEKDEFDAYAHHFLLKHKRSGEYAGTVRFVLPANNGISLPLPFEKYCLGAVNRSIIDPDDLIQGSYGEVSRLAVPASFRKRAGEQGKPFTVNETPSPCITEEDRRQFPNISVSLYLACAAFFVHKQIDYTFVMAEPRLARCLARVGIVLDQAGEITDYHGQRAPFYISQKKLATHLKPEVKPLFNYIKKEVIRQLPIQDVSRQKHAI